MKTKILTCFTWRAFGLLLFFSTTLFAQEVRVKPLDARMFRYPDVSTDQITFVYAGDVWVAPITGGLAYRLTTSPGEESFPRFSPDGTLVAFTANYDGTNAVYVMPVAGGTPQRLTWHSNNDRTLGWTPDGLHVLFASSRESGSMRFNQLYTIPIEGGIADKLPVPYGEFGSFSPDGKYIAYIPITRDFRTWKRYVGGMAPDIWLFDLQTYESNKIAESDFNDTHPMWHGNTLYFLSDRDNHQRFNIWAFNMAEQSLRQVTHFTDYDIRFPSKGNDHIIFEAGGRLFLMDVETETPVEISIEVVTDNTNLRERLVNVERFIQSASVGRDGNRVLFEARGDIFSVPAEHGVIFNLTQSSGVAERFPSWSPDGEKVVYWSDRHGEYDLYIKDKQGHGEEVRLTDLGPGFRFQVSWSPDSRKLAFTDQQKYIYLMDVESRQVQQIDQDIWLNHGGLQNFFFSWSADSRWLTYSRALENRNGVVFIYDTRTGELRTVTSDFYSNTDPVFDADGDYLFMQSARNFSPAYSAIDNTWIYPNATQIFALPLRKDVASPLAPRNDTVTAAEEKKPDEKIPDNKKKGDKKAEETKEEKKDVIIDFDGLEARAVLLPMKSGNYGRMASVSGKLIFHHYPNTGSPDNKRPLMYYDLKEREEKSIIDDVNSFELSADGKKLFVTKDRRSAIINVAEKQEMKTPLRTSELSMNLNPRQEWDQIFVDAWRIFRDYFYDKNMHGVDWVAVRDHYQRLLGDAVSRYDVNFLIGEMIGELNASHTYRGGGDTETEPTTGVGYLGVDWSLENGAYRIARIIRAASWDSEVRSPLDNSGVQVNEGDYILAVNGEKLNTSLEPFAAFQNLAGKTIELTVNDRPDMNGARKVLVETLSSESRLRNLAWIEQNRKRVEEATNGRVGYIYVPSTGVDGQNELVRQFRAQFTKDALIIDERFNSGGQIPDRFIELLDRDALVFWGVRSGKDWQWPPFGHFGPKAMLINGWSGSGGDAFPDYFKKRGLGPLIGERTWGGLIGISGAPSLIDGGSVSVPTFRMYDPDGTWFPEGHGVDPDIPVVDDPSLLARGIDPQLETAIQEILRQLEENPFVKPERPPYEDRRAPALREQ
jgi:tricorn protease